jgi:hypothetical protein
VTFEVTQEGTAQGRELLSTAGDYVLLCPLVGQDGSHYKLGQLAEFAIE